MSDKPIILETRDENSVTIAVVAGSLDASLQRRFKEELDKLLMRETDVVLDFFQVSFVDSSCLGLLVSKAREAREKKGDLKLARLCDDVRSIFQITRLDRVFSIFDSIEEAVSSYYK